MSRFLRKYATTYNMYTALKCGSFATFWGYVWFLRPLLVGQRVNYSCQAVSKKSISSLFVNRLPNTRREHKGFHLHFWIKDISRDRNRCSMGPIPLRSGNVSLGASSKNRFRNPGDRAFVMIQIQASYCFFIFWFNSFFLLTSKGILELRLMLLMFIHLFSAKAPIYWTKTSLNQVFLPQKKPVSMEQKAREI